MKEVAFLGWLIGKNIGSNTLYIWLMCNNCTRFRIGKQINAIASIWVTFMLERIVWKTCQPFYQTICQNHVSDLRRVCCI